MKLHSPGWARIYRPLLTTFIGCYLRLLYRFESPLPRGPKIFAVNHPTVWDAFPILVSPRVHLTAAVVEDQIWSYPLARFFFVTGDQIKLWRDKRSAESIADTRFVLSRGDRSILIAPEGSRTSLVGAGARSHRGPIWLAIRCRAPIIPIGVWLSERSIVRRRFHYDYRGRKYVDVAEVPRLRARYAVTFGPPISYERWYGRPPSRQEYQELVDQLMAEIHRLAGESRRGVLAARRSGRAAGFHNLWDEIRRFPWPAVAKRSTTVFG